MYQCLVHRSQQCRQAVSNGGNFLCECSILACPFHGTISLLIFPACTSILILCLIENDIRSCIHWSANASDDQCKWSSSCARNSKGNPKASPIDTRGWALHLIGRWRTCKGGWLGVVRPEEGGGRIWCWNRMHKHHICRVLCNLSCWSMVCLSQDGHNCAGSRLEIRYLACTQHPQISAHQFVRYYIWGS